jgi:hypothetical protein
VTGARAQKWVVKVGGAGLGNPLAVNPLNENILYGSPGSSQLYVSRNRGYEWQAMGSPVPGSGIVKSVALSPGDTSTFLLGVEAGNGSPDYIVRSTNRGSNWTVTWHGSFSYYGDPVEFKPSHPDTVFTMSNDTLFWSLDFGSTWSVVRAVTGLFNAWCDAELRSDSGSILFAGDNSSGIWKSTDYGQGWTNVYHTTGEIPSIAIDHHDPRIVFAAKFGDGGGMVRSTDGGDHWSVLPTPAAGGNLWWVTTSTTEPGYVYVGSYGAMNPGPFVSADHGSSWRQFITADSSSSPFNTINYSLLAIDTQTVIALQANGIWKLQYPRTVSIVGPNGGESIRAGSLQTISWSTLNVSLVRIHLSTDGGGSWSLLADSLPAEPSSFEWMTPSIASSQCLVKVTDILTGSILDVSDGQFSVYMPSLSLTSPAGGEVIRGGSLYPVAWSSSGFGSVTIAFSTDLGTTWNHVVDAPADSGMFNWKVPPVATSTALLWIRTPEDSLFDDLSGVFSISAATEFSAFLRISELGGGEDTLEFGSVAGATDGIDSVLGEADSGPIPGPGMFDARWILPGGEGSRIDFRDSLSPAQPDRRYHVRYQTVLPGNAVLCSWDPDLLGGGLFLLQDRSTGGNRLCIDMQVDSTVLLTDSLITDISILHSLPVSVELPVAGDWRLTSIPVTIADRRVSGLFPFGKSPAYGFESGYRKKDTLEYGSGYWMISGPVSVTGCPRNVDTLRVYKGWNIVGSVSRPVSVQSITTIPDSILSTGFYAYEDGYSLTDTIHPGRGYWIKAVSEGELVLESGSMAQEASRGGIPSWSLVKDLSVLHISETTGASQSLYFGVSDVDLSVGAFEMPPAPPGSRFLASFDGDLVRIAATRQGGEIYDFPISLSGDFSQLKMYWDLYNDEKFSYILLEKAGSGIARETPMSSGGSVTIEKERCASLSIRVSPGTSSSELPQQFSLNQNYPNPFNPGTRFSFTVPRESFVTVRVYSILGQTVATLVNGDLSPGLHWIGWNGLNDAGVSAASGLYVVVLSLSGEELRPSERGIITRKILLLK